MRYRVSPEFIATRRAGPRRGALMLASVFALFAVVFVWQSGLHGGAAALSPLLLTGAMLGAVGYFQSTRMAKATAALSSFSIEVAGNGLAIESSSGQHLIKASEVKRVLLFRSVFSTVVAYVGLELNGRFTVVPPLQDNAAFAKELQSAMPHAAHVEKRKLLLYLGI
jgi:hypothetical protein